MSQIVLQTVLQKFPQFVVESHANLGDETVVIKKEGLFELATFLKTDPAMDFSFLMDLTCVDYLGKKEPRFEVVCHFYSLKHKHRLRVKSQVSENDCTLDTLSSLWAGANWFEREVWDLYGVRFNGHPDPRRILMYEEFVGHPLRKDYPIDLRQPRLPLRKPEERRFGAK